MLDSTDKDEIFALAEELVGTCQSNTYRSDILTFNVFQRMQICNCNTLDQYIAYIETHSEETDAQKVNELLF